MNQVLEDHAPALPPTLPDIPVADPPVVVAAGDAPIPAVAAVNPPDPTVEVIIEDEGSLSANENILLPEEGPKKPEETRVVEWNGVDG
ncbi:hypothetical protein FRC17_005083, partial [Serendipita sp. 399]